LCFALSVFASQLTTQTRLPRGRGKESGPITEFFVLYLQAQGLVKILCRLFESGLGQAKNMRGKFMLVSDYVNVLARSQSKYLRFLN
jgi:hypothetical protein